MSHADAETVSRRKYLEGLALSSAIVGLAGCSGESGSQEDDGGGETADTEEAAAGAAGERVPTVEIEYWSDRGSYTRVFESSLPGLVSNLEEGLGISAEAVPVAFTTQVSNNFDDKRTHHLSYWTHSLTPTRLDPFEMTFRWSIEWAGANGLSNPNNYANCEHSVAARAQAEAGSTEERRAEVAAAQGQMSEDIMSIPIAQIVRYGAYNADEIEAGGLGQAGIQFTGYRSLIDSSSNTGQIVTNVDPVMVQTSTHPVINGTGPLTMWNHLIYSTLLEYNEEYELENVLVSDYTVEDEATTFVFELRDGTFHNGEEITAEDVKFTFEFLSENSGEYSKASSPPYESIEVVDDKTVQFNMETSYLPLLTRVLPRWGVMPKSVWEGANAGENPRNVGLDPVVGSGPYQVESFNQGSFIELSPHDGHPVFSTESDLTLRAYQDAQSAFRAFSGGDINMFMQAPAGIADEIRNSVEFGELARTEGFLPYVLYPQMPFGPQKFEAFRHAVSQSIDRNAMNQTALFGDSETIQHSSVFMPTHPWYTGEDNLRKIADSEAANPERARQILQDAGWTFDDDGRLHYPDDADLSPTYPEGEVPMDYPEQFPCVSELES